MIEEYSDGSDYDGEFDNHSPLNTTGAALSYGSVPYTAQSVEQLLQSQSREQVFAINGSRFGFPCIV